MRTIPAVTACFSRVAHIVGKRWRRNLGRYYKRTAHKRVRRAVREFVQARDWDGATLDARPVTSWDVC